ncbi:hypothetical protein O181_018706 [Austropuccinia psidii MF-1]|uniref:Uncharacterized protein n=1 Tax=Austropuccinia psidii MF-1 TaxID=1389203 RepID=A0A9Q3GT67_9BASI|nr:hypothetical protein [Austropuccinia psidii MF-1]
MSNACLYSSSSSYTNSDGMGSPLSPDISVDGFNSSSPEIAVLTHEEIVALRRYSHSVQNFTYQLFENFQSQLESKNILSAGEQATIAFTAKSSSKLKSGMNKSRPHSSKLVVDSDQSSPEVARCAAPKRKPSDRLRKKGRDSRFPEGIGL